MSVTTFSTRLVSTKTLFVEIKANMHIDDVKKFFEFCTENKITVIQNTSESVYKDIELIATFPQEDARKVIGWLAENDGHYEKWKD